jgi:hypothetical protein
MRSYCPPAVESHLHIFLCFSAFVNYCAKTEGVLIYAVSLPYNLNTIRLLLLSLYRKKGFLSRLISIRTITRPL